MRPTLFKRPSVIALAAVVGLLGARQFTDRFRAPRDVSRWTAPSARPRVEGDAHFAEQVASALDLLAERAPAALAEVEDYVGRIRQGPHSGMHAYEEPPTLELADRSAFYSVSWCAGAIVHDAHHSRLYHEWLAAHGPPVPAAEWTGTSIELVCNQVQLDALRGIGAPAHEQSYLAGLDGTHWDVNRDGVFDERDVRLRDW